MTTDRKARPPRRLHIDRLELDLRGVSALTAGEAARLLPHALEQALAQALALHPVPVGARPGTTRIEAGRIGLEAAPDAVALAARMAQRIAASTGHGE